MCNRFRSLTTAIAIAATLGLPAANVRAAAPAPVAAAESATLRARLQLFDQVWSLVRDFYYDPGFNGADWAAARARYRPLVSAVRDDAAFDSLLRMMLGELRDAHTRLLTARQASDRRAGQATVTGVILFEVEGEPVVFDVRPGSPAAEAGLRPGMRVLEVDGVPVREAVRDAAARVGPSSSERAALMLAYLDLVSGPPEKTLRLRLATDGGAPFEVELGRRALDTAPSFESRRLPSGHLYVKFDRFRAPVARLLKAALEQARDAPGLILDLRSNPGGDGREGMKTIAPLFDRPTLVAQLATRSGKAPSALLGLVKLPLKFMAGEAGGQAYSGPVAILTNQGTASTSEVIAAGLQERGRARIVGSRSCGCALGVLKRRKLKNGAALAISEVGLLSGLGRRIEGAGVVPDVPVELKLADLRSGRDRALETAVSELEAMRRGR